MKVLVTGGAGFIGSHTVDLLLERGHEVVVLDNFSSGHMLNLNDMRLQQGLNVWERSISRPLGIMEIVDREPPDSIIHLAAQPSLRRSLDDPAHDALINIVGTLNVIAAAKASGAHVVFASTSAIYADVMGNWDQLPIQEEHPTRPQTPYGLAKLTAERYLELSGISYTVLRYGNVYGPRQVQVGENQLIPHCLAHILDARPFTIHGDGEQTRDFVYVGDIARANVLAAERKVRGVFNAGTGKGVSVNAVCGQLAALCGVAPLFTHDEAKDGDARHVALDSTRAADRFGWRAETPIEEGLRATVGWWRERD